MDERDKFMLKGKIALVTGASSGIGLATALAMSANGAKVGLVARKADALGEVAQRISRSGGEAVPVAADVTLPADCKRAVEETVRTFGGLDILVNAAGIISTGTIENTSFQAWREMMDINLDAVFQLWQAARP